MINEDGIGLENLEAALEVGCSWGYYSQGYGSDYPGWKGHGREKKSEELSGYQTVPVNWGINTSEKRAFFTRVKQLTAV